MRSSGSRLTPTAGRSSSRTATTSTSTERPRSRSGAGDVYARHGSRSEPWSQADIAAARARLVSRAKDAWRAEHAEETRLALRSALAGAAAADGPAATFTWRLDEAGFEAVAVELVRRADDIPVRRMLRAAQADTQEMVRMPGDGEADDLAVLLDRIAALAALGLELQRPVYFDLAVAALLDLYGWAVEDRGIQTSRHHLVPVLWLWIAERLYAVGGLAVRLRDWPAVRSLPLTPVPALDRNSPGRTWHRDALTQTSRAGLFKAPLPDDHAGPDPFLTSATQLPPSGRRRGRRRGDEREGRPRRRLPELLPRREGSDEPDRDGARHGRGHPRRAAPRHRRPRSHPRRCSRRPDRDPGGAVLLGWGGYTDDGVKAFLNSNLPPGAPRP